MSAALIVSASDPQDLRFETSFDCILVSSLFTHLPAVRFSGWLRRLGAALTPGGMLLFSVHDLSLRREGPPPASGIAFSPQSESGSLSTEEYGTAWVSEEYVRSAVKAALGDCAVHRIPRGLANIQDIYVVIADADLAATAATTVFAGLRVQPGLVGFVEHCSRYGRRRCQRERQRYVGTDRQPQLTNDIHFSGVCPECIRRLTGLERGHCDDTGLCDGVYGRRRHTLP